MCPNCRRTLRGVISIGGWLGKLSCFATHRLAQPSPLSKSLFHTLVSKPLLPCRVLQVARVTKNFSVEEESGRSRQGVPLPPHRTGRADFPHPALRKALHRRFIQAVARGS